MKYTVKKTSEFGQYGVYDAKGRLVPDTFYVDKAEAEKHAERLEKSEKDA